MQTLLMCVNADLKRRGKNRLKTLKNHQINIIVDKIMLSTTCNFTHTKRIGLPLKYLENYNFRFEL